MRASSLDEVLQLVDRWAAHNYDEQVSQLDHALQCAALATADGADDALVAAALLHDVGHLLELAARDGLYEPAEADRGHEQLGATYLAGVFGPEVTEPIALHVAAKRYRCAVDPTYAAALSPASAASLELQGGPASDEEVAAFEHRPGFADALRLRGWDDRGKVDGLEVRPLEHYRSALEQLVR